MATVQVRMDENVKKRFDELVNNINKARKKNKKSELTNAQVLELAIDNLSKNGDLLK